VIAKDKPDVMRDSHDDRVGAPAAVRALAALLRADTTTAVLERACLAASAVLPQVADVSVTVVGADGPRTVAASGELALQADEAQYSAGAGPCMEAAASGEPVLVQDLEADQRWAAYARTALGVGLRASLSVPLRAAGMTAALNLYARTAGAFEEETSEAAADLAGFTAAVLSVREQSEHATALADQMQAAMEFRAVIEQAKGIVMAQRGCGADEAFEALVRLSQEKHRKLRDVALKMVEQVRGGA
jgi:GAF domain-containing protein